MKINLPPSTLEAATQSGIPVIRATKRTIAGIDHKRGDNFVTVIYSVPCEIDGFYFEKLEIDQVFPGDIPHPNNLLLELALSVLSPAFDRIMQILRGRKS